MGKLLIVASLVVAGLGYLFLKPKEAPDISETRARAIAEKQLDQFCGRGGEGGDAKCTDFYFKGQFPPSEDRFKWSYHFLSEFTDPRKLVIVSVSPKGEFAVQFEFLPPEYDLSKYGPPPGSISSAAAEAAPAQ